MAAEVPLEAIGKISLTEKGVQKFGSGVLIFRSGYFLTSLHNLSYCLKKLQAKQGKGVASFVGQKCTDQVKVTFPFAGDRFTAHEFTIAALGSLSLSGEDSYQDWALLKLNNSFLNLLSLPEVFLGPEGLDKGVVRIYGFPLRKAIPEALPELHQITGHLRTGQQTETLWKRLYEQSGLNVEKVDWLFRRVSKNFLSSSSHIFYHSSLSQGYSGGPIFDKKNRLIGINWGSLALWSQSFGPMPKSILGLDPANPKRESNGLAAGQSLRAILESVRRRPRLY